MSTTINLESESLALRSLASEITHETAADWYNSYGAHTSTEHHGDLTVTVINADWQEENLSDDEIREKLLESYPRLSDDEIEGMIGLSDRVWESARGVVSQLEEAVRAHRRGDLEDTIEALRFAQGQETDHGDDPATMALAAQLLADVGELQAITAEDLDGLADGLEDDDWVEFASRLKEISPILGEYERLHAEAADGNSPNVKEWERHALEDAQELARAGIATPEEAAALWNRNFNPKAERGAE